jgi:hypothetical protein
MILGNGRWLFFALVGAVACSDDAAAPADAGANADSSTSGSSSGGSADGATEVRCTPDALACNGKVVARCNASGAFVTDQSCIADCVASPSPHCGVLEPKYVGNVCDTTPSMPLTTAGATTLDTTTDANCTTIVPQTSGPDVCVVAKTSITIAGGALTVTGTRALALVAVTGDVVVSDTIDVGATKDVSGPGGDAIVSGAASTASVGGGGAGFGTAGAAGGDTATGNGGAGGAAVDPLTLGILVGGARAPKASAAVASVSGGGGGGALTLIACRGTVTVSGTIDARGGGGAAQRDTVTGPTLSLSNGGAGGGSGGYVVLQGLDVRVTGQLYANGGGGGGGNTVNDGAGQPGEDGKRSATVAALGGSGNGGGNGGNGGIQSVAPTAGGGTTSGVNGGGGGGAHGRFRVYTPSSVTPTLTPSAISPAFEPSLSLPTH